jgi:hypothetical protein
MCGGTPFAACVLAWACMDTFPTSPKLYILHLVDNRQQETHTRVRGSPSAAVGGSCFNSAWNEQMGPGPPPTVTGLPLQ